MTSYSDRDWVVVARDPFFDCVCSKCQKQDLVECSCGRTWRSDSIRKHLAQVERYGTPHPPPVPLRPDRVLPWIVGRPQGVAVAVREDT